jgi:hypothetical protein
MRLGFPGVPGGGAAGGAAAAEGLAGQAVLLGAAAQFGGTLLVDLVLEHGVSW